MPQDSIRGVYDQLRSGDVVALVSPVDGLNVAHTGLVYAGDDGGRGLLHASLDGGVVVSPDLQRYVQKIDGQIGMVVARPRSAPSPHLARVMRDVRLDALFADCSSTPLPRLCRRSTASAFTPAAATPPA